MHQTAPRALSHPMNKHDSFVSPYTDPRPSVMASLPAAGQSPADTHAASGAALPVPELCVGADERAAPASVPATPRQGRRRASRPAALLRVPCDG